MTGKINIEIADQKVWIETTALVAMYAGDRGTKVYATAIMNKEELKTHIEELAKTYQKLG